jgi:glyoxylase-like metal-dependent hydrolase (beta-lactamase superfamily II)
VLHTPGHTRAHVCLWSPADRLLISGDHVLPVIAPPINFHHGFDDDPLGQYLDGLATVVELDPALVLPGHGPPLRDGARRAEAISRAKRRRIAATLGSLDAGPASVREITDRCFTGVSDHQHVRLAMTEALAHLAYLRKRGMVLKAAGSDGIVRFERRPAAELASC